MIYAERYFHFTPILMSPSRRLPTGYDAATSHFPRHAVAYAVVAAIRYYDATTRIDAEIIEMLMFRRCDAMPCLFRYAMILFHIR